MDIFKMAEDEAKDLLKKIEEVFNSYKDEIEVHITSDAQIFLNKNHADGHGTRLPNKGVATVSRESFEAAQASLALSAAAGDGSLAHPEGEAPTTEEIAAKASADQATQAVLNNIIAPQVQAPVIENAAKKAKATPDVNTEVATDQQNGN